MRFKLFAFILFMCASGSAALGSLRLALIGTGMEKDKSHLLDLAEVKLSQDNRLELIERKAIRAVLAEQKLSLSGLVSADQAVAAGKLLRVEIFAFVQSLGADEAPVLTVFDGFNGARLVDVDLPKEGVDAQVDAITLGIDRARSKLVAGLHDRTVCLLAVRNADLSRQMDAVCNATAKLLERRLLDSSDIRLLERKRLEAINQERQLGTLDPKHDILASVVAIELEFSRGTETDQLTVTALLSDAAGKPLVDAQGNILSKPSCPLDKNNVAEAVNQLAAKIADGISVSPGTASLDPVKEGKRFKAEAHFLLGHAQITEGLQAAESAYALSPDAYDVAHLLSFALLRRADEMVRHKEGDVAALEMATRALEIRDTRIRKLRKNNPRDPELIMSPDNLTGDWIVTLLSHALTPPASEDAAVATAARQLGDAYMAFAHDCLISAEAASAGKRQFLAHHTEYIRLNRMVRCMALASRTMSEYVDEVCGLYERYLKLSSELDEPSSLLARLEAGQDLGRWDDYWAVKERGWTAASFKGPDREKIERLFQSLIDDPSAGVSFYGWWNRVRFERPTGALFDGDYAKVSEAARSAMGEEELIVTDRAGFFRNQISLFAMSMLGRDVAAQRRLADRLDWYEFFIGRHQITQAAIYQVTDLQFMDAGGDNVVSVLGRLQQLIDNPHCKFIGCSEQEARVQFAAKIRYLAGVYPAVRAAFMGKGDEIRSVLKIGGTLLAIDQVVADRDAAYAITLAEEQGRSVIQARLLNLDGSNSKILGSIPDNVDVNDACLTDRWIVVATDHGIFLYPRDGQGCAKKISSADGLPTDVVQSVTMLGDVIYAGLGDRGYLVSYDIGAKTCKVLASSRRKQKASPFDDVDGFAIVRLVADEAKHRILLVHCHGGRYHENGLWQLDPDTGEFKQLLELYFDYSERNAAASRLLPDHRVLINSRNWALAFDANTDTAQMLFADSIGPGPLAATGPSAGPATRRAWRSDRRAAMPFAFNKQLSAPYSLVGDTLWAGDPLSCVEPQSNQVEPIDLPAQIGRSRTNGPPSRLRPTTRNALRVNNLGQNQCEWIVPLPDGEHVIAGNARELWLVPTSSKRPATQPATRPSR